MDLENAVSKHTEWKTKFRSAISKKEMLDVVTISRDNCCELGKWLHGSGKAQHGSLASFKVCLQKHALFHLEAGKIATAINSRKYSEAETMIGAGTDYTNASTAVAVSILRLKKDANL